MTFKIGQSNIRTIKADDPKFHISDGLIVAPRAGFQINDKCPYEYKLIILECLRNGWLLPIANLKDNELFWEEFKK